MKQKGIMVALLTAFISGISIFVNGLFVSAIDPILFVFIRNAAVLLMLTLLAVFIGKPMKLNKSVFTSLVPIGVIGGGIPFILFFSGLSKIGGIWAGTIHKTMFIWVAIFASIFIKEKASHYQKLFYGLILGVLVLSSSINKSFNSAGVLMVIGATALWALEHVLAKNALKKFSPLAVSWSRIFFGLPVILVFLTVGSKFNALFWSQALSPFVMVPAFISSGFLIVYMLTWYKALSLAPASLVSLALTISPFITITLTALFTSKVISFKGYLGSAVIATIAFFVIWATIKAYKLTLSYGAKDK